MAVNSCSILTTDGNDLMQPIHIPNAGDPAARRAGRPARARSRSSQPGPAAQAVCGC
ncbi:hypothetical protein [Planctomicrobium piriforme]|uniref:hypothetical protein n=1 Tax=Planctomicrobium piriforme TaxID=1576369 RepID=UPI0036F1D952